MPQAEPAAQMEDKKEKMVINPIDEGKEKNEGGWLCHQI